MELLQRRCERVARTAVRTGENQQHAAPPKFFQREFTAPVKAGKAELGRSRAGLQAVTLDLAAGKRTAGKSRNPAIAIASTSTTRREKVLIYFGFWISDFGVPSGQRQQRRLRDAGASMLNVRFVHHSLAHFVDQLAAMRELMPS